jgi:hypothetical protein
MGFWKTFGKWAIPAAAIAATVFTGGAAAPLIGMAIGAGSSLATSKLAGQSWKSSLINAGIGGALGGVGAGALKGMGGFGSAISSKGGQAALAAGSNIAKRQLNKPSQPQPSGMGTAQQIYQQGPMQQGQGYLNPLGLQTDRRTNLMGMGTRQYV